MACKRVIIAGERVVKDFVGKYLFSLANQNPFPECFCVVSDYPELGSAEKVTMPSMAPTPNNTPRKESQTEKQKYK